METESERLSWKNSYFGLPGAGVEAFWGVLNLVPSFEECYVFHRHEKDAMVIGDELCLDLEGVKDKFFVRHGNGIFQVVKQQKSGCPGIWGVKFKKSLQRVEKIVPFGGPCLPSQ